MLIRLAQLDLQAVHKARWHLPMLRALDGAAWVRALSDRLLEELQGKLRIYRFRYAAPGDYDITTLCDPSSAGSMGSFWAFSAAWWEDRVGNADGVCATLLSAWDERGKCFLGHTLPGENSEEPGPAQGSDLKDEVLTRLSYAGAVALPAALQLRRYAKAAEIVDGASDLLRRASASPLCGSAEGLGMQTPDAPHSQWVIAGVFWDAVAIHRAKHLGLLDTKSVLAKGDIDDDDE